MVEGKRITLYRNSHPISRAYSAKDAVAVESLEEILELSRSQNVLEHVYVLPDIGLSAATLAPPQEGDEAPHLLVTQKKHRAHYSFDDASESYTVFISQYGPVNRHWRADGQQPVLMNLGMMPVFINVQEGAAVSFTRWKWLVGLEAVALWVTLMCLVYLWPRILKSTGLIVAFRRLRK